MYYETKRADCDIVTDHNATEHLCACAKRDSIAQNRAPRISSVSQDIPNSQRTVSTYGNVVIDDNGSHMVNAQTRADLGARTYLNVCQKLGDQNHYTMHRTKNVLGERRRCKHALTKAVYSDR